MSKRFTVTGICIPHKNYMVDIGDRLETILTDYIDKGKYFTINRARQYGKTTTLYLLEQYIKNRGLVIRISLEAADEMFASLYAMAAGFIRKTGRVLRQQSVSRTILENWNRPLSEQFPFDDLSERITELCRNAGQNVILMIDEVDKSSDNQIFLSFLGLLRTKYLGQLEGRDITFQSVILAGVYDIKNLKLKIHPQAESKYNSPWNIAADFMVSMSFSAEDIALMLAEYEQDHETGMDTEQIGAMIYMYTSGYPYLVSRICQLIDERLPGTADFPVGTDAWTPAGVRAAELLLRRESNTLLEDMVKQLDEYPRLRRILQNILFCGARYPFEKDNFLINLGLTLGFLKEKEGSVQIANRIFETKLYDLFLSEEAMEQTAEPISQNQFVKDGRLQMNLVMEKFYEYFTEIYSDREEAFLETQGRKIFLIFLKPIINGTGNYYIEAETRDRKRTDIIVDYRGEQFIIELKIWHGNEYNQRGEEQLFEYLQFYRANRGYLLSFCFSKKKKAGIREISGNGKKIMEVVV